MVPEGWEVRTIDQIKAKTDRAIAIGPFGSRMKSDLYVSNGVPVIRGNNISDTRTLVGDFVYVTPETADELASSNVFPGDLFFPHRGAIGLVGVVPEGGPKRYILSTSLMKLSCNAELVDPLFVFYFFRSDLGRHQLLKHTSTVGTPGIGQPLASLRSISIQLPPLPEQHAIADVLSTLDDKIELNRRMNETLEAMARALFKSWFVDFDPVRARVHGRDPAMSKHLADLFPGSFENSGLGKVPKGWEPATLSDFCLVNSEAWSKESRPNRIKYVDLSNTKWGRIEAINDYDQQDAPSRAQRVLRLRDTIVGTVRPANGSYAFIAQDGLTASTGFAVLRPVKAEYAEFAYLAASAPDNIDRLGHLADGAAYPAIHPEVVAAAKVVKPPDNIMQKFSEIAGPLLAKIASNDHEAHSLATQRDVLLPKLISGELRLTSVRFTAARTNG
jgi:type I restriction enzyme, S subunit